MNNILKKHLSSVVFLSLFVLLITLQLVFKNIYIVLMAFLVLSFGLMFGKKKDRILILVFALPFSRIYKLDIGYTSFYTFLMIEYFGLIVLDYIISKKPFPRKAIVPLISYILIMVYSLLQFAIFHKYMSISRVFSILLYMLLPLMFFVDGNRMDNDDKIDIVKFMIFGFLTTIVISALSYISPRIQNNLFYLIDDKVGVIEGVRRFSGLFGDSNYYGFYTLLLVSLGIYHLKSLKPTWLYLTFLGIIFGVGFLSLSMMYFIVSIVLMVILFVLLFKSKPKAGFIALLSVSLGLILVMLIMGDKIMGVIMAKLGPSISLDDITTGRASIWEAFINFFLNNPLLLLIGNGINSDASYHVVIATQNYATHNVFLEILYDFGLIGGAMLVVYYILSLSCYGVNFRQLVKNKESLFFIIAFLLCGLVLEIAESDYTPFFLTVFACTAGTLDKQEQQGLEVSCS